MDEPSANLDSDAMVRLGALLYRLKEAGIPSCSQSTAFIMSATPLTGWYLWRMGRFPPFTAAARRLA